MINISNLLASTPELSILVNQWLAALVVTSFSVYLRITPNFSVSRYIGNILVIARSPAQLVISGLRSLFMRLR